MASKKVRGGEGQMEVNREEGGGDGVVDGKRGM